MDYVREELRRQNAVLSALMRTDTPEKREPQKDADAAVPEEELRSRAAADGGKITEGSEKNGLTQSDRRENVFRSTEQDLPAAVRRYAVGTAAAAGLPAGMMAAGHDPAGSVPPAVMTYGASEETSDIRGMSRTIQRDARRYDGGFFIY